MKTRPRELLLLACLLAIVAGSFPLQIMAQFGDPPWDPAAVLSKITPLNWVVMALATIEALLLREASPWVRYIAPFFLVAVIWNNWLVGSLGSPLICALAWTSTTGAIAIHGLMFSGNARRILAQPKLRWWKTPPRLKFSAEAILYPADGGELRSNTVDISETGLFVSTPTAAILTPRGPSKALRVGSYCSVRLRLSTENAFACTVTVVRRSDAKGSYPEGFGLCFVGLNAQERKNLAGLLGAA